MITYKTRYLLRGEVWYDEEPEQSAPADWVTYFRLSKPCKHCRSRPCTTLALDLQSDLAQLTAGLNKDTAYKVRRARERDKVTCEVLDPLDRAVMDQFEAMYNGFAQAKNISPLDRARMSGMASAGRLDLSAARDAEGNILVYHANYRDKRRATSIESPSLFRDADKELRSLIGRANRLLTWSDITRYRESGLEIFDFGGWYEGSDPHLLSINEFKKGFGGRILREYEGERATTLKGWLATRAVRLFSRAGSTASRNLKQEAHASAKESQVSPAF